MLAQAPGVLLLLAQAPMPEPAPVALLAGGRIELSVGAERRPVAGSEGTETFAWDRDGEHLLITRAGRLERLALAGGAPEVLAQGWQALRWPDVAPDGARVVFAARAADAPAGDGEAWRIVLLERASGATRELCDGYDPCFARDGARVFCERYPGPDLWRVALAGGEPVRVFEPGARHSVRVDPFTARLAFSSERRLVLRALAGSAQPVPAPADAYDRFASFAPDRRQVLFFREHAGFRGIRARDLVSGAEHTLAEDADLALHAPPTLAGFEARARAGAAARPIDAAREPELAAWLEREARASERAHLVLADLTELAPAEAAALRGFGGRALFLPRLAHLEPASAALLAEFRGSLFLDGLLELDVATARALAGWRGNGEQLFLSLDGLRAPAPEVLAELAACRGWGLSLDGLETLPPAAARALAPVRVARLELDGVRTLERASAEAIAAWQAKFLSLRAWRPADPEQVALVRAGCAVLLGP